MRSALQPPSPQSIVVFGASGDLTRRKILPALYSLAREGLLPERCVIMGYARSPMDDDGFRAHARDAVAEFSRVPPEDEVWSGFAQRLFYVSGPFDEAKCFGSLHERLRDLEQRHGIDGGRLYYCATPPSAFPLIAERLGECGDQRNTRIVIEKPFGRDAATASQLNRTIHEVFNESQVFRIDHYLGKETVQNILVFRFANSMFERVWNRDAVDHVQITVAESLGVEGRGAFYEEAGATRDILQNHLLQLLSFVAMEPPRSLEPEAIRDEKVKVLRTVRPFGPDDVVRGQYVTGAVDGAKVRGYRDEDGVAADSTAETFVAVRATIDDWRWAGVPFYLRTGKRLARRLTEVAVVFRDSPAYLFDSIGLPPPPADHLTIRVQPEEGISLAFEAKQPGPGFTPKTVRMDFSYGSSFTGQTAEAYERLLHDAMVGDHTLFTREDEVERAWEIVAPALELPGRPRFYEAGTWGPNAADLLIAPRSWHVSRALRDTAAW